MAVIKRGDLDEKNKLAGGEGGEAEIFRYKGKVLKVFKNNPNVDLKEKEAKIKVFLSSNFNLPANVIKPIDLAYLDKNEFIGYLMDEVKGEDLKNMTNKRFLEINNVKLKRISEIADRIFETMKNVHKNNLVIGDFNDNNILFDAKNEVYFIDTDSWSIGKYKCSVVTDNFKDPLLKGNEFTTETDFYSLAVILFKLLTRVHPFGGKVDNLDMSTDERIAKRISVINKKDVVFPFGIKSINFLSPELKDSFLDIFEKDRREIEPLKKAFDNYRNNLKYCDKHEDFYFGEYTTCPVCNAKAAINSKQPIKVTVNVVAGSRVQYQLVFTNREIGTIISEGVFINTNGEVVFGNGRREMYEEGARYYYGENISVKSGYEEIEVNGKYRFKKRYRTKISVVRDTIFYISLENKLTALKIGDNGNSHEIIADTAFNSHFYAVSKEKYFIINQYPGLRIFNISGKNYILKNDNEKIENYGIHYDASKDMWLLITENRKGEFVTRVFKENNLEFETKKISYINDIKNGICFDNKILYKSGEKKITGYSYEKNIYKDFECQVADENSILRKTDKGFRLINRKEIYDVF